MFKFVFSIFTLTILFSSFVFAQVTESQVDYTISPGVIQSGQIQYSQEWLEPHEFKNKELRSIDLAGVANIHPDRNQMVAAKVAFISRKSFNQLSHSQMNKSDFISEMLDSVGIYSQDGNKWRVTNKVKAYGLPFKISFDLKFQEVSAESIASVARFLRDESSAFRGTGRERFLILDMTNFTHLTYRNYSVIYIKEISSTESMVVAGIVAGINISAAAVYFPFGPKNTLMSNMRSQVLTMARNIQSAK